MTIHELKSELRRVIAEAERATPGPWHHGCLSKWCVDTAMESDPHNICYDVHKEHDAAFIVTARTFTPPAARALLVAVEALEDINDGFPNRVASRSLQSILAEFAQASK